MAENADLLADLKKGQEEMSQIQAHVESQDGEIKKQCIEKIGDVRGVKRDIGKIKGEVQRKIEKVKSKVQGKIEEQKGEVQRMMQEVKNKVQGKIGDIEKRLSDLVI
ncbi:hypothetical protein AVEN_104768-1 [Araneus ventricosus]|uniref:Uncharacterized protein n=1 Tax=Araneus ventricosus TaxID=182803 RepID=A0A4Y2KED2_ARAVE|nr:hypothetical protein AVEN_104768-1 [Araneus ventricosus]